jgi:hypothetical protein
MAMDVELHAIFDALGSSRSLHKIITLPQLHDYIYYNNYFIFINSRIENNQITPLRILTKITSNSNSFVGSSYQNIYTIVYHSCYSLLHYAD